MNIKLLYLIIMAPLLLTACDAAEQPVTPAPQAEVSEDSGHGEAGHKEAGGPDEHEDEEGEVVLSPEQIKAAGITLLQAGPAQIRQTLPLYGVVAPNAERVREVAARFPGAIRNVAKKIGDSVREGEALATVEANESLQTYAVTAPLAGVIITRNANPGEQTGDKTLFTVADLSTVWVELSLFPRDVAKVRVGQNVRVKNTEAGLEASGKVVYVAAFGQAANQTLTARVMLDNPERRWAPGLYVTTEVTLTETAAPLAIRKEAVQMLEGRSVAFVQDEDGGFVPHEVTLGRSDGEFTEVLTGLNAGDTYAAANSFIIKAELGKGSAEHGH